MELPPRARRIPRHQIFLRAGIGTTSACAENTPLGALWRPPEGNYLRVRGEYLDSSASAFSTMELPPRARRIRVENMLGLSRYGTTSACAENTQKPGPRGSGAWNYLRVRGEYINYRIRLLIFMELPPRARRIPGTKILRTPPVGTTSACAENTKHVSHPGRF